MARNFANKIILRLHGKKGSTILTTGRRRLKFPDNIHIEQIDKVRVVFSSQVAPERPSFFIDPGFPRIKHLIGASERYILIKVIL